MYYRLLAILSDIFDYPQWLRQMHLPAWWTEGVKKGKVILKELLELFYESCICSCGIHTPHLRRYQYSSDSTSGFHYVAPSICYSQHVVHNTGVKLP
ncbi:unnamed protein product [Allacma fusca]|uniref:Uncharacterized protein n=1 Tax=Allacma fusca TaxID=39272 RepID=A0A8J2PTB1_9HEXA|nr:unnamed protein product [Allacma fusca]